tara:strand:+ start:1307 stop:2047 length:741 start_codon:yes stop_codon:yes gene_type:complete
MLKKLHKIIGLSVCLIIIHLSITGIILMYPSTFKLQDTYFTNNFIYSLYGMYSPSDVKATEDIGVVKTKIIISDMVLEIGVNDINGAIRKDDLIFVSSDNLIMVIRENDYDLEIIKEAQTPFIIKAIGIKDNKVIIKDINSTFYTIDQNLEFALFEEINGQFNESFLAIPDIETANYFLSQVQGPGIQALRLVADLHNGRFFGPFVMLIFTVTSFLIIFLSISGTYIAIRPSVKRYFYRARKKKKT